MTLQQRKEAFKRLGEYLLSDDEQLLRLVNSAHYYNNWFSPSETHRAVKSWGRSLSEDDLNEWLPNDFPSKEDKRVGLVLAGNIPLVGFHDVLSVLASGCTAVIKLSSQDKQLVPHLLQRLIEFEPAFKPKVLLVEKLEAYDAVLATGSNNTSRYFDYYFRHVPHIIRKNRNSVAVLSGDERAESLNRLGDDIFSYFGLGCRNVSKLYVPENYDFDSFFKAIESYKAVSDNHKYNNNYDYNKSIFLVNGEKHLDNGFLLLKPDAKMSSPLAVLYYEEYRSIRGLSTVLKELASGIQVIVSEQKLDADIPVVGFGESQQPRLWDYADGVNTLEFLRKL